MKARAWLHNPDPRPRGVVFRVDLKRADMTPYWGGLVTVWNPDIEMREAVVNSNDDTVTAPTQRGAIALIEDRVARHREANKRGFHGRYAVVIDHTDSYCMNGDAHPAHTWWYTHEDGGHMLHETFVATDRRDGKDVREWHCPGRTQPAPPA